LQSLEKSFEEWTKYLEEQEKALEKGLRAQVRERPTAPAPTEPEVESTEPKAVAPKPKPAAPVGISGASRKRENAKPIAKPRKTNLPPREALSDDGMLHTAARLRKRIPGQLSLDDQPETASKGFKETREQLLSRLLDPQLSLEDAARLLNVCPTTVRRYTNRGLLPHLRTAGNQRRFRLSDVLAFLEAQKG